MLIVLCVTEITSWGLLYYAFPVLATEVSADTGWSPPLVTAAFSLGQVANGCAGVLVGRMLDRHSPRVVMTTGSALASIGLVAVAESPSLATFLAAWTVTGVAMAAVLYQPAFAALTRWYGPRRVSALTVLTLAGGLASTVFAPVVSALSTQLDWRHVYLVLGVALAVITIPAHAIGLRLPWPARPTEPFNTKGFTEARLVARSPPFLLLCVAMSLSAFAVYAAVVNLIPLLVQRGLPLSTAAFTLGLGGVGQVLGRLGFKRLADRTGITTRTVAVLAVTAATTALLGLLPGPAPALIVVTMAAGMARGIFTLLQATAVSDRWGTASYGRLNGLLAAPMTFAAAVAPWAGSLLASVFGGYPAVFLALAGAAALSAVLATRTTPPSALDRRMSI